MIVDQPAACGVDENRAGFHLRELIRADQVFGFFRQRAVQRKNVAASQHLFKSSSTITHDWRVLMFRDQHFHTECASELGHRLSKCSKAENSECRSSKISDRVIEQA